MKSSDDIASIMEPLILQLYQDTSMSSPYQLERPALNILFNVFHPDKKQTSLQQQPLEGSTAQSPVQRNRSQLEILVGMQRSLRLLLQEEVRGDQEIQKLGDKIQVKKKQVNQLGQRVKRSEKQLKSIRCDYWTYKQRFFEQSIRKKQQWLRKNRNPFDTLQEHFQDKFLPFLIQNCEKDRLQHVRAPSIKFTNSFSNIHEEEQDLFSICQTIILPKDDESFDLLPSEGENLKNKSSQETIMQKPTETHETIGNVKLYNETLGKGPLLKRGRTIQLQKLYQPQFSRRTHLYRKRNSDDSSSCRLASIGIVVEDGKISLQPSQKRPDYSLPKLIKRERSAMRLRSFKSLKKTLDSSVSLPSVTGRKPRP